MWSQDIQPVHRPLQSPVLGSRQIEEPELNTFYGKAGKKAERGCGRREEWSELAVVGREHGRLAKDDRRERAAPCRIPASSFVPAATLPIQGSLCLSSLDSEGSLFTPRMSPLISAEK